MSKQEAKILKQAGITANLTSVKALAFERSEDAPENMRPAIASDIKEAEVPLLNFRKIKAEIEADPNLSTIGTTRGIYKAAEVAIEKLNKQKGQKQFASILKDKLQGRADKVDAHLAASDPLLNTLLRQELRQIRESMRAKDLADHQARIKAGEIVPDDLNGPPDTFFNFTQDLIKANDPESKRTLQAALTEGPLALFNPDQLADLKAQVAEKVAPGSMESITEQQRMAELYDDLYGGIKAIIKQECPHLPAEDQAQPVNIVDQIAAMKQEFQQ